MFKSTYKKGIHWTAYIWTVFSEIYKKPDYTGYSNKLLFVSSKLTNAE